MAKSDQDIVADMLKHVGNDTYSSWYAGIAAKPRERLFTDHKVNEDSGRWIFSQATNDQHARSAESMLHAKGFDGGTGGGDNTTVYVYAYKKTSTTVE